MSEFILVQRASFMLLMSHQLRLPYNTLIYSYMAHQNLLFDTYVNMDRTHASHYALNNVVTYDAYPNTGSQYSDVSHSSLNGAWDYPSEDRY